MSDNLKVKGLLVYGCVEKNGNVKQVEDAEAEFFGLYAVMSDIHNGEFMGNSWLQDFPSRQIAEEMMARLSPLIETSKLEDIERICFEAETHIAPV